jgi:hypothetical protein
MAHRVASRLWGEEAAGLNPAGAEELNEMTATGAQGH